VAGEAVADARRRQLDFSQPWTSASSPTPVGVYAEAVFDGTATDGVHGRVSFHQSAPTSSTLITVQLIGMTGSLEKGFGQMHVHERRKVVGHPDGACSVQAVGGHWNPRNRSGPCTPTDLALCEVGDISGKHGVLTGSYLTVQYLDDDLPLSGPD
jgi:hypothetical protein